MSRTSGVSKFRENDNDTIRTLATTYVRMRNRYKSTLYELLVSVLNLSSLYTRKLKFTTLTSNSLMVDL